MLIHPTLEEVQKAAASISLSSREAAKFFYFYDSKGWKVGKQPMKSLMSALQGWKLRNEDKTGITEPSLLIKRLRANGDI